MTTHLQTVQVIVLFLLFFTLPANLFLYGVNDIFDYETDRSNEKKSAYETLALPAEHARLTWMILALILPFAPALPYQCPPALAALAGFLFCGAFYSAPPIRAKARPILDSAFNVLYALPGLFAYLLVGGTTISVPVCLAAWLWTMAMHAYSAVPDIEADRGAGLQTIATLLGFRGTLLLCLALYIAAAVAAYQALSLLAVILGFVYTLLMLISLRTDTTAGLLRIYRWFPLVNTLGGMAIFLLVAVSKLR